MNKNSLKTINKLIFLFLSMATLGGCGDKTTTPTPQPDQNQTGKDGTNDGKVNDSDYSIVLGKHEMNLVINTSERISFDFEPDIPDDYTVTWKSNNDSIAKVSSSGMVTGLAYGEATITATMFNGKTDTCKVTVGDPIDYVSNLKLDMNSNTKKAEVTTHLHVDGDTTHFNIDSSYGYAPAEENAGVLKARYLGCDTPESTGKDLSRQKAA